MAWETRFTTTLHFNRRSYTNYYEVSNDLDEVKQSIEFYENRLKFLVTMTEPKKFCEDDQDPMFWLQREYNETIEELRELYVDKFKLECVLEGWDRSHNAEGEPIHPPKDATDDFGNVSYIDGDWIMTKEEQEKYRKDTGIGDEEISEVKN